MAVALGMAIPETGKRLHSRVMAGMTFMATMEDMEGMAR
jgi:hypothetical protein